MLTISVVIPTYKREEELVDTIECALQALAPCDDLLVVDQTPEHSAPTAEYLARISSIPVVRIIHFSPPSLPMARNIGCRASAADIILYIDDDVLFSKDLLDRHRAHYANRTITGVAGEVRLQSGAIQFAPDVKGGYAQRPMGCHMSFRRKAILELGGFDTNFIGNFYHEEIEFAERIWYSGGTIADGTDCSLIHRVAERGGCEARVHDDQYYLYELHNYCYRFLKLPVARRAIRFPKFTLSLFRYHLPPFTRLRSPRFLSQVVIRAVFNALRTRRTARPGPYWPDGSVSVPD